MKRKTADIASFFSKGAVRKKKPAEPQNDRQGEQIEEAESENEGEECPVSGVVPSQHPVVSQRAQQTDAESESVQLPHTSGPRGPPDVTERHHQQAESENEGEEPPLSENEGEEPPLPSGPVGPPDISKSRADGPVQPHLKLFPRTLQGDRRRNFQASWYHKHSWLEYSQSQDSAYCFACRHFGLPNIESAFTSVLGYKNWKKATYKDGGFALHAKGEPHINAMMAFFFFFSAS